MPSHTITSFSLSLSFSHTYTHRHNNTQHTSRTSKRTYLGLMCVPSISKSGCKWLCLQFDKVRWFWHQHLLACIISICSLVFAQAISIHAAAAACGSSSSTLLFPPPVAFDEHSAACLVGCYSTGHPQHPAHALSF